MFEGASFFATIAVKDVQVARKFWETTLGMTPLGDLGPDGSQKYEAPGGQIFCLYPSQFAGTADHTVAGFEVDNVETLVGDLRSKGVKFEDYDLPGLKTENGIASMGDLQGAWFKDPDGNIVGIVSRVPVHA